MLATQMGHQVLGLPYGCRVGKLRMFVAVPEVSWPPVLSSVETRRGLSRLGLACVPWR